MSRYSFLQLICDTGKIFLGHIDTITGSFSCWHEKLSSIVWTPVYTAPNCGTETCPICNQPRSQGSLSCLFFLFQDRRGAASSRHKTAPKSPFSCVSRRPIRYGFHVAARTIRYSVAIALKSFKFVLLHIK